MSCSFSTNETFARNDLLKCLKRSVVRDSVHTCNLLLGTSRSSYCGNTIVHVRLEITFFLIFLNIGSENVHNANLNIWMSHKTFPIYWIIHFSMNDSINLLSGTSRSYYYGNTINFHVRLEIPFFIIFLDIVSQNVYEEHLPIWMLCKILLM